MEAKTCRLCGIGIETSDGRVRYCDPCKSKRKAANERAKRARLRDQPKPKPVLQCQRCGCDYEAKIRQGKWCPSCKPLAKKEYELSFSKSKGNTCIDCGSYAHMDSQRCIKCSNRHRNYERKGDKNPSWKGGKTKSNGYVFVHVGDGKNRYRGEHILVWEKAHGQPIPHGWIVHHLNGIKDDNRPENLAAMSRNFHHAHPREALRPYEHRIHELEELVRELGGNPGSGPGGGEHGHHHDL